MDHLIKNLVGLVSFENQLYLDKLVENFYNLNSWTSVKNQVLNVFSAMLSLRHTVIV